MSVAPERAREACESCRKSHKRCTYDDNSIQCLRCEKRNVPCSLFLSVDTTAVAQQGPSTLMATEPAPDSWDGTPHVSTASSSFPYSYFPPQGQEQYHLPSPVFTQTTQEGYPADMFFQAPANQHETAQPVVNQDGSYVHNSAFQ